MGYDFEARFGHSCRFLGSTSLACTAPYCSRFRVGVRRMVAYCHARPVRTRRGMCRFCGRRLYTWAGGAPRRIDTVLAYFVKQRLVAYVEQLSCFFALPLGLLKGTLDGLHFRLILQAAHQRLQVVGVICV